MILSAWVDSTLEEMTDACTILLSENVEEIDIVLEETDGHLLRRYLRVVIRRNQPQEGDDETPGKSD